MTMAHLAQAGVLGTSLPDSRFNPAVSVLQRIAALSDGVRLAARLVDAPPNEMHTDAMVGVVMRRAAAARCKWPAPMIDRHACIDYVGLAQVEEAGAVLQRLRKHEGTTITVIRGEELQEKGLGGLYGVGKAAERPPALVVLSKAGGGGGEPSVVCVGKGIVYDTGGLSIKTKARVPPVSISVSGLPLMCVGVCREAEGREGPLNHRSRCHRRQHRRACQG